MWDLNHPDHPEHALMADDGVGIRTPENAERDDAGRDDDSPGFDIQARMFAVIGAFLAVVASSTAS